jgi:hypothetical protein
MIPIATNTLTATATTITFSSIPQTYTDLILVFQGRNGSGVNYEVETQLNGDTGTNYSFTQIRGTGSVANSGRASTINNFRLFYTDNTMSSAVVHFINYSNSTTYKTYLSRSNSPSYAVEAIVGLWRNTAAITSISMTLAASGQFQIGATFTLYGIKAA